MSWLQSFRKVLVLSPHTDDEMGCAGTIARLTQSGAEVHYVALSRCEESVPAGLPHDVLETEARACAFALGIGPENTHVWGFKVRYFPRDRQDILERFVGLSRALKPDLVLAPSAKDIHQDHGVVAQEAERAFKNTTLWGYELVQNLTAFDARVYVQLSVEQVETKIRALRSYRSQQFRAYAADEYIRSLARVRGMQTQAEYAEAFELVRMHGRLTST